ncbi:MBOAT family O-acyltransferase [Lederbergia panacisoli]|uniref:MBOAT family O-acyltransferase n=1 Tax=Lederbergia panacisoli TaxID=1255251 RepID=UPI00214C3DF4|nr:MBOAT family O-acyltransferase [Lederbergia panacisoli]MCR2820093.1 MBOAT family protein [Lederbergia panacisoli]
MVFSSLVFLFVFLPITLFIYFISPNKLKNLLLLFVSLIFYAWGEPIYILLMLFSAVVDYVHGIFIAKFKGRFFAKLFLFSSLFINIGILSFFKYANFFIENLNLLLGADLGLLNLPLPIGISFYTFQTMSYTIDVYRGRVQPQKNPIALAMYVCLFPQLIAGPIVRYETIEKELIHRRVTVHQFAEGIRLFIIGLGKKVLLANNIGFLWNSIEGRSFSELTVISSWLGIIAFALQIYFDFSGYSDMARGLGKMFGFNFPVNFQYPYLSRSITEFWRRWHMTLSGWFRDYVYIPLGGSREGKLKLYRNLFIVWGLTGFWHGASWNFIVWGLYFGLFIAVEKGGFNQLLARLYPVFQHLYFIFFILIGWVLFVFEDLKAGFQYLSIMFGLSGNSVLNELTLYELYTNGALFIIAIIGAMPVIKLFENRRIISILSPIFYFTILLLSTAFLVNESYNPFLYFRF